MHFSYVWVVTTNKARESGWLETSGKYSHSEDEDGQVGVEADQGDQVDDDGESPDKHHLAGAGQESGEELHREEGVTDKIDNLEFLQGLDKTKIYTWLYVSSTNPTVEHF